jgi:CcmD family protein
MQARITLFLMVALPLAMAPHAVLAAPATQDAPGESNLGFLFAGFAVVWVAFFAYVFYISRREREMRREVDELRQQLLGLDQD